MRGDFLHARLVVHVPQPDGAVVRSGQQVQSVGIHRQTGDRVQMGHHRVDQRTGRVVPEPDVSILVGRNRDRERRMADDLVDVFADVAGHLLAGLQLDHLAASFRVVDDAVRTAVRDHDSVRLVPYKVYRRRNTFRFRSERRVQLWNLPGRGPQFDGAVRRTGHETVFRVVDGQAPDGVGVSVQRTFHHLWVVAVVRVNVGVGQIPAVDGPVQATRVALLTGRGHGQTQHRSIMRTERVERLHVETSGLLGWHGFLQVPQLQGVVLRGSYQHWFLRVERQRPDTVKVRPQRVFGVPGLAVRFLRVRHLVRRFRLIVHGQLR